MREKQEITRDDKGRWKSSGNPKGRPKKKLCVTDMLREYGQRLSKKEPKCTLIELVAKTAYELAISGNMRAIEFITERIEGKVPITPFKIEEKEEGQGFQIQFIDEHGFIEKIDYSDGTSEEFEKGKAKYVGDEGLSITTIT